MWTNNMAQLIKAFAPNLMSNIQIPRPTWQKERAKYLKSSCAIQKYVHVHAYRKTHNQMHGYDIIYKEIEKPFIIQQYTRRKLKVRID